MLVISFLALLIGCSSALPTVDSDGETATEAELPIYSNTPTPSPAISTTTLAIPKTTSPIVTSEKPTIKPTAVDTVIPASVIPNGYGNIDISKIAVGSFGMYGSLQMNINNAFQSNGLTNIINVNKDTKGFQPIYIINRINKVSERKTIGTGENETIADIPIRRLLHENSISNILSITSDLVSDKLKAIAYNKDNTLTISGFTPGTKRVSTISYIPDSEYKVSCVFDGKPEINYMQAPLEVIKWVTFDQNSIIIPPDTYAPIWINMSVPEGSKLPNKWQFWIEVQLSSGIQGTGVSSEIVYRVGYKVDMR
jgi:hypothetical protein